jgi:hypothetical protein
VAVTTRSSSQRGSKSFTLGCVLVRFSRWAETFDAVLGHHGPRHSQPTDGGHGRGVAFGQGAIDQQRWPRRRQDGVLVPLHYVLAVSGTLARRAAVNQTQKLSP